MGGGASVADWEVKVLLWTVGFFFQLDKTSITTTVFRFVLVLKFSTVSDKKDSFYF